MEKTMTRDIQKDLLKRVKIIKWHTDSEIELRKAERQKTMLENKGYSLISEECGLFTAKLVYKLN